jgi:mRNA-degrading endonuclease RelE of RelBE toxin-antitoxin system
MVGNVRYGSNRIIYEINGEAKALKVMWIRLRKEVYQKKI